MAALDDYGSASPTWLVLCRTLDVSPTPLLLTELQQLLLERTDERVGRSVGTLTWHLTRLVDDGLVGTETQVRKRRRHTAYTITDAGRELVTEALAAARKALALDA